MHGELSVVISHSGKPQTFQLQVSTGRDQQLDVYFLMDFSASLEGDLETLRTLARELS